MIVDQAGHQRASAARDDASVRSAIDRDGLGRDCLNLVAAHQNVGGRGERGALAIEDAHVLEQRDSAARLRTVLRAHGGWQSDSHEQKRGNEGPPRHVVHVVYLQDFAVLPSTR